MHVHSADTQTMAMTDAMIEVALISGRKVEAEKVQMIEESMKVEGLGVATLRVVGEVIKDNERGGGGGGKDGRGGGEGGESSGNGGEPLRISVKQTPENLKSVVCDSHPVPKSPDRNIPENVSKIYLYHNVGQLFYAKHNTDSLWKICMDKSNSGSINIFWNMVISTIHLIKKLEEAEKLFKEMLAGDVRLDTLASSLLLKELCMKDQILDGFYLLEAIENKGFLSSIDSDIYSILLIGLCQRSHLKEATKLAKIMLKKSVLLRPPHKDAAIDILIKFGEKDLVNQLLNFLSKSWKMKLVFIVKWICFFLLIPSPSAHIIKKGITGASYIPIAQGGLSHLLGAAAPPRDSARENRCQCLKAKVLRLWVERKIFPETVLRRYMDDIEVSNDDMTVSFSLKHPSRAEGSLDDPIREMEGMLVDLYGSNATFQLPSFLSSHLFEEDEDNDFPSNSSPADVSRTVVDSETSTVTPSDKRHCILEDVNGELEMEDVSGHLKEERPVLLNSPSEMDSQLQGSNRILDPASNISAEIPDILEVPPQSLHQSSPLSGYQHSVPHNFSGSTNSSLQGNQIVQMAGNSFPGGRNSSVVNNEILQQPSACFPPMAGCNSQEPCGFNPPRQLEYGQNDMYLSSRGPQPNLQLQPANSPFAPRHMHPAQPLNPSNQYSYPNPTIQQHLPHSLHPFFSLPSLPDGQRQFVANEQWRMSSSEGLWIGRNPSCPTPPFGQEGMRICLAY
ncbi:ENHANCER OF AG-4 protein 2 [Glycine soja]